MFSNNQKISGRQLNRMMTLDLFAVSFMLLPKFLLRTGGGQGIYALILGTAAAAAYAGLLYYTATRYKDHLFGFICRTWGRAAAWLMMLYLMLRFLFSAVYLLKMFAQVINRTFLTEMPEKAIAALMIVTALYGVSKGMEARGRFGGILLWLVVIPIFTVVLFSLSEIKPQHIFPMEIHSGKEILRGGASAAVLFGISEFVLFAAPYVRNRKKGFHFLVKALIFGAVTAAVIYLACIGVMSVAGAGSEDWPSVILMQIIRLPGRFMSRQDGVMLIFWIAAAFMVVSGYIFYADEIVRQLSPARYSKGLLILWLIIVYGAVCMVGDYQAFEQFYFRTALWGGMIPTALIMAALVLTDRKKSGTPGGGAVK